MPSLNPAHAPHSQIPIKPHPARLWIVTAIFNPHRFRSRYRLYKTFAERVAAAGAQLVTVEIAFGNRCFEVTSGDNPYHVQLTTEEELWHKERALNIAVQRVLQLDPKAEYIAWVDADVSFARSDWVQETLHKLEHHPVVQMFSETVFLGPNEEVLWKARSIAKGYGDFGKPVWNCPERALYGLKDHPGLAWAFRRRALDQMGGFLDFCIAGSGDLHMVGAWSGNYLLGHPQSLSSGYKRALKTWADRADAVVKRNYGYVQGLVLHHWHGKAKDRGYDKRWDIMVRHQFDPWSDLIKDTQGLWRFAESKTALALDLRRSLQQRNEDSIDN